MTDREQQQTAIFHKLIGQQTEAAKSADASAYNRYRKARKDGPEAALQSALGPMKSAAPTV